MTSSIINWIVDKYLSNMLEINKEQTKSSLWNGEFEMSNLKIKPEIFTNMNIPYFELVHGYVGKMKISLSLPRFYLYPIKVEIDKVFFHAKQKKLETIQKSTEIYNMEQYKKNQLQSQEELENEINNLQSEGQPGMMSQIINNLEIIINDICIRFDDDLSYDLIPFSFGVLLKNIHINTVDKNFQFAKDRETIPFSEINYKIIEMSNLSIYLDTYENQNKLVSYLENIVSCQETQINDEKLKLFLGPMIEYYRYCLSDINKNIYNKNSHQYLFFNLGFKIQLSMNENLNNGKPQYEINCELNTINMSISLVQIKALMKLLAYQDLNSKYQLGLSKEFYTKKINNDDKLNYIENYISYFQYKYGQEKNEQQAELIKVSLDQVENGLKYSDIQKMRNDAQYRMKHDKEIDEIDKKLSELKGGTGFFSFFSSGPSEEQLKEIEKLKEKKNKLINEKDEETKERLKKQQFQKNNSIMDELDDSFCVYKAKFILPELNFDINRQGNEKMSTIIFKNFKVVGEIRKQGQFLSLSIGDINIKQYQLKNTVYTTLIASIEDKNSNLKEISNEGAFYIEYENNPSYEKSNFLFKFRNSKRLIITINLYSIQYILNKVLDSLATTISKFGSERYIGTGDIQNLIKSGFETNYISGGYQHFNLDLDIEMKSPIILYPQDILDKNNNNCLLIRCGDLSMKSILPPRQDLKIDYTHVKERDKLFDIYIANLQKFCMETLDSYDGDLTHLLNIKGLNLVDEIQVEFRYEQLFENNNNFFEKMKVVFNIGKCKFNMRDIQLIFFIDLLKNISKMNKQLEFDLENKTILEQKEEKQNKEDELKEKEEKEKKEKERKKLEEKTNKNKKSEKKKKNIDNDCDNFILEFNLENIELCLMKSISKKEREIVKNKNNLINDEINNDFKLEDNEYRDFVIFQMNQFEIYYLSKEKGDMYIDISILSTIVKDKETLITEKSSISGDPLINPDFQELIQMKSTLSYKENDLKKHKIKRPQNKHFFNENIPFEIIHEEENEENEDKYKYKFMVIHYKKDNKTGKQTMNILLQKIQICFSMNAMARAYQYYSYYWGLYCKSCDDSIIMLADMEEDNKKQKLREKLTFNKKNNIINDNNNYDYIDNKENEWYDISEMIEEDKERKKLFGKKFLKYLENDLNSIRIGRKFKKNLLNKVMDSKAEKKMKDKKEELKKIIKTNNIKGSMAINLEMKETILDFPLEDTKSETKILRFKFNLVTSYKSNNEYNESVDGNGKTLKIEYISDNMKISCKILNIGFNIMNYPNVLNNLNKEFKEIFPNINNYNNNQIIQGFRFQTNINSFLLLPYREKSVMAINVIFEPLIFSIGFRQTKIMLLFLPKLSQFLTNMYSNYDDPLKELINDNHNNINNENSINLINFERNDINENNINNNNLISCSSILYENIEQKLIDNKEKIQNYKIKELERQKLKEKKTKINKEKEKEKESNKIINNTEGINYMKDIKVAFDKISIKFLDDSNNYLIPLLNIEANQTIYKLIMNSDTDSVENISNLILESISRKEVPLEDYDINGLSFYMELIFNICIDYYNDNLNIWEPIVEQYNGVLKYDQVTPFSRTRMIFYSDDFFNMNISITSMNVLNRFLKKYKENEEKWQNENENKMNRNINNETAVEFLNLSGMDIDCWFDAEKSIYMDEKINFYKFKLDIDQRKKREVKKLYLDSLYRQLSETQINLKKDKFTFQIKGYMPVYNNDFSKNYSTSFRIKKEDKVNDEINEMIKSKIEKNSEKKDSKKIKGNEIEVKINQLDDIKTNSVKKELLKEEEQPNKTETEISTIKPLYDSKIDQLEELSKREEEKRYDNTIEILIKIRQKGTFKSVLFISNIYIFNNLQIPISLSFISEKDLLEKYHLNEENINFNNNTNNIIINCGKKRSIPLLYLMEKYRIYVSFHNKENEEQNKYSLLFTGFENLRKNLDDFIKYDEENNINKEEDDEQKSKDIKLNDYYSQLITIQKNKKNFYVSSNLVIQRGKNDIIKGFPSKLNDITHLDKEKNEFENLLENNKYNFYCKTYWYLFILDESLLLENQLPYNIQFNITGSITKEVTIRPLQKKEFLDVNQENSNIKLIFNYQNIQYNSNIINIKSLEEKYLNENDKDNIDTLIKLYDEDKENDFIECNLKIQERFSNISMFEAYERKYEHCLYSFQKKKKLIFYSKYIIINRTENLYYLKGEEDKNKDGKQILPLSLNLMNNQNSEQSFKIRSEKSSWSDKFHITVGNTGVMSLEEQNEENIKILDITLGIQTSWFFSNSLLITVESRFILVNKIGFDIEYKQYNNKLNKDENENIYKEQIIKNNDNIKISLVKNKQRNAKKMIQIKFNESKFYSCPFDLEEIGEIDLKIQINEQMKNIIEEKNKEIEKQIKESIIKEEEKSKKEKEQNKEKEEKEKKIKKEKKELSQIEERKQNEEQEQEKIEKIKLKPRKYIVFQQNNEYYLLVHVGKLSSNNLIYIIIYPPKNPKYIIENQSQENLTISQKKDNYSQEKIILEKNSSIPYVWGDLLQNEKLILVTFKNNNKIEINLNQIKIIKEEFIDKNNKYLFYFQTIVENNSTRKLIIKNEDIQSKNRGHFLKELKGQNKLNNIKYKIDIKGIGLSIISNEPKEIFYISFYGNMIDYQIIIFKKDDCDHTITNIGLIVKNIQIDYCLKDNFKSMLIPLKQITPQIEDNLKKGEELIPVIQGIISLHNAINPLTQISSDEFPQLDITFQAIKLNLSQYQVNSLINLYNEILPELDFWTTTPPKIKEYNSIEDLQESLFGEKASKKDILIYDPEHYDKNLEIKLKCFPEELISNAENNWMFFIKYISLGAMDFIVSTRIDINSFGDFLPSIFMGVLSAVGNVFTHITDYHIKLTSLLYTDVFTDFNTLYNQLYNEYFSQVKRRIFKIFGNLDILGNPTNYARSIGEGFLQLIEEPRKGLINGPLGFGEGIAKGFGNLITTIISGALEVVTKISGTLLASLEVLQGNKALEQIEEKEPENIIDGIFKGFKEGITDLGKGIGGIFLKPYEQSQKKGIKGFFKGLGKGILGAVVSPFTATFRITSNILIGIKNTVNMFNPKIKTERFRYPRVIDKNGLRSYNEDKAVIKAILNFLDDYEEYEIIYYSQFTNVTRGLEEENLILVLTNKCVMTVYKAKEIWFNINLEDIKKIEVHKEGNYYDLIFYLKDGNNDYIRTKDLNMCVEFYLMFEKNRE